jgi:hypothetical protein
MIEVAHTIVDPRTEKKHKLFKKKFILIVITIKKT